MGAMFSLEGQVAIVTGAGQGNGRAIALGLSQAGAAVAVLDVAADLAASVTGEIEAFGSRACRVVADVGSAEACEAAVDAVRQALGPVSVLVNNAGILRRGGLDTPGAREDWHRTFAVNVDGAYNMVQAARADLAATQGSIVNLGSIQSFVATPNSAAYTASKGAILGLTRALAAELAPAGIRVNGIAPGFMNTPMTEATQASPERMEALLRHVPMARIGQPEELVGAVVFLASRAASYVTGIMLPVDGGYLAV